MAIKDRLKKNITKSSISPKAGKKARIRSGIDVVDFFEMSRDITGLFIYDNENIFTDRNGVLQKENDLFDVSVSDLIRVIVTKYENNFVSSGDSYIIETENGTVINIISKPYLHFGSFISFQKKRIYDYSLNTFLKDKVLSVEITSFLRDCLVNGQNIFVVGDSTIDKRPILSYLSELVFENLAIIEGIENIYTSTQNSLIFSKSHLPFKELISKAFSLSHNFIVTQCDDIKELMTIFEYINMGYKHFVASFCANSKDEMINNLKNTIMLNYSKMSEKSINHLINSSVDIVVYVNKSKDGKVRITDVSKLVLNESGLSFQDIYKFDFGKFVHENLLVNKILEPNEEDKIEELFSEETEVKPKRNKKKVEKKPAKKIVKEPTTKKKKTSKKKAETKSNKAASNPIKVVASPISKTKEVVSSQKEETQKEPEKKKNKLQLLRDKIKRTR